MRQSWLWPWVRNAQLALTDPVLLATPSQAAMRESQRKLPGLIKGAEIVFPSHDDGPSAGISLEEVQHFAASVKP